MLALDINASSALVALVGMTTDCMRLAYSRFIPSNNWHGHHKPMQMVIRVLKQHPPQLMHMEQPKSLAFTHSQCELHRTIQLEHGNIRMLVDFAARSSG